MHQAALDQRLRSLDVDRAPVAALAPRRQPLLVRVVIDRLHASVDPAEAQCLLDRFEIHHAALAARRLVEADPQLGRAPVVLLEPAPELLRVAEEPRRHRLPGSTTLPMGAVDDVDANSSICVVRSIGYAIVT